MGEDFTLEDLMKVVEFRRKQCGGTYAAAMAVIGAEIDDLVGGTYRGKPYDAFDALLDEISVGLTVSESVHT